MKLKTQQVQSFVVGTQFRLSGCCFQRSFLNLYQCCQDLDLPSPKKNSWYPGYPGSCSETRHEFKLCFGNLLRFERKFVVKFGLKPRFGMRRGSGSFVPETIVGNFYNRSNKTPPHPPDKRNSRVPTDLYQKQSEPEIVGTRLGACNSPTESRVKPNFRRKVPLGPTKVRQGPCSLAR